MYLRSQHRCWPFAAFWQVTLSVPYIRRPIALTLEEKMGEVDGWMYGHQSDALRLLLDAVAQ